MRLEIEIDVPVFTGAIIRSRIFITESGVHGEIRSDLPVILDEAGPCLLLEIHFRSRGCGYRLRIAEKKIPDGIAGELSLEGVCRIPSRNVSQAISLSAHFKSCL